MINDTKTKFFSQGFLFFSPVNSDSKSNPSDLSVNDANYEGFGQALNNEKRLTKK